MIRQKSTQVDSGFNVHCSQTHEISDFTLVVIVAVGVIVDVIVGIAIIVVVAVATF